MSGTGRRGGRAAFGTKAEESSSFNNPFPQSRNDNDFVPPMKFARREGVQFALVTLGHKVHADLLEHSDFSLEITL